MARAITFLFCYFAPGCLVLIGLIGIIAELRSFREAFASRHWSKAEGIIRTSTILVVNDENLFDVHVPVEYENHVDGRKFTGTRIFHRFFNTSYRPVMSLVLKPYPVGAGVAVFYDPVDPNRCVLRRGLAWPTWLSIGIGIGLVLLGAGWAKSANWVVPIMREYP